MLIIGSEMLDCLDDIETEVLLWKGTYTSLHKYGGIQFNCNGKELGHIHSNGILDIRFSKKTKTQLMIEGKIAHHHIFKDTGWISFYIKGKEDNEYAIKLLKMAYSKRLS